MNCKKGDLARVIYLSFWPYAEGVLVEIEGPGQHFQATNRPAWKCKLLTSMRCHQIGSSGRSYGPDVAPPGSIAVLLDEWMRPIRGSEGDDETLQWAGKPQPAEVH